MLNQITPLPGTLAPVIFAIVLSAVPLVTQGAVIHLEFEDFAGPGSVMPRSEASGLATHEILTSTLPPDEDPNMLQTTFVVPESGLYFVDFFRYSNDNESLQHERVQLFIDNLSAVVFDFVSQNTRPDGFPLGTGWNIFETIGRNNPDVIAAPTPQLEQGVHTLWVRSTGGDGFNIEGDTLEIKAVPEPTSLLLAALAGLGLAVFCRARFASTEIARLLARLCPSSRARAVQPDSATRRALRGGERTADHGKQHKRPLLKHAI